MRLFLGSCFTLLLAAVDRARRDLADADARRAFGSLTIGAWTAWPKSGSLDIDPYARATIARTGELPIGTGDGVAFYARTDDAGNTFDGRCTFVVSGMTPGGALLDGDALRPGRPARRQLRSTGTASPATKSCATPTAASPSTSAPRARPGNWLPTGGDRAIRPGLAALRYADRRRDAHHEGRADAGDRAKGLLMIRLPLWILGALLLGGIVHLSTVLAMPQAATQDAYSRLAPLTPVNAMVRSPRRRPTSRDHAVHGPGLCGRGMPIRSFQRGRSSSTRR